MTAGDQQIVSEVNRPRRRRPAGTFALAALILAPFVVAAAAFVWWLRSPPSPEFSYPYGGRRVSALRFSPDGSLIAACEHDDGLTLLQVADGQRLGPTKFSTPIMQWNPAGTVFAAAVRNGTECVLWDSKTWEVKKHLRAPAALRNQIAQRSLLNRSGDRSGRQRLSRDGRVWGCREAPELLGIATLVSTDVGLVGRRPRHPTSGVDRVKRRIRRLDSIGRTRHFSRPGLLVAFRRDFQSPIRSGGPSNDRKAV